MEPSKSKIGTKVGLECPNCGCKHFQVLYTRAISGNRIMRRRECRHCGRRITTYEQLFSDLGSTGVTN